ncbi:MAG: sigma-70 region 4 domain-containing protein, partial [Clostridia bacterium]|nr:sigma-70 region 4 domain-containing protein [Clostridia bacterium]
NRRKTRIIMKVTYKFLDGTQASVEVTEELAKLIETLDNEEKNNNRRETRRHNSLNSMMEAGFDFQDHNSDFEYLIRKRNEERRDIIFFDKLKNLRKEQYSDYEKILTKKQLMAYWSYRYEEKSKAEIAREMGITEGAVRKLLKNAEERIKRAEEEKLNAEYEEKEKKWQEEKNSNPITAKMPDEEYLLKKIFGEI